MGKLHLTISDDLEEAFRAKAAKKYGLRKGSLTKALEEALKRWIKDD